MILVKEVAELKDNMLDVRSRRSSTSSLGSSTRASTSSSASTRALQPRFKFNIAKAHKGVKPEAWKYCGFCCDKAVKDGRMTEKDMPPDDCWFPSMDAVKQHQKSCKAFRDAKA